MRTNEQIQVVYICPHVDGYGADRSLFNSVIELRSLGVSPFFIIPRKGLLTNYLESNNIPYIITGYKTWTKGRSRNPLVLGLKSTAKLFLNRCLSYTVANKLKSNKVRIVHTNDLVTNFGVELSKRLNAKHIVHSRCLLHESSIYFDLGEKWSVQHLSHNSAAVIFNSKTVQDHYQSLCNGVSTHVIHSAIFSKKDIQRPVREHDHEGKLRFIFMGRYEKQKDPLTIVKAVKLLVDSGHSDFHVSMFGKLDADFEDYYKELATIVSANNLGRFVSLNDFDSKLSNRLQYFDVGLFTSPMEGIARVLIEFMINGLPVISSNTGAASFLVKNGYNGLHFIPCNEEDLAAKMEILLKNRALVDALGKQAFESIDERFSNEFTSTELLEVYKTVLREK